MAGSRALEQQRWLPCVTKELATSWPNVEFNVEYYQIDECDSCPRTTVYSAIIRFPFGFNAFLWANTRLLDNYIITTCKCGSCFIKEDKILLYCQALCRDRAMPRDQQ